MPDYKYVITSQTPDQELNAVGNGFISGWRITYKVSTGPASGTTGTLFVPDDDHNADSVKSQIEAKLKDLHDIASLGQ